MATVLQNPDKPSTNRAAIGLDVARHLATDPTIQRVKCDAADIYYLADFVTPAECVSLIRLIDQNRRPSTLLSGNDDKAFRTSESCDMDRYSPIVQPIDERIAILLGIDPSYGETMQGQRYAPGQQFRAHHDYFHGDQPYWPHMMQQGGQRTWTAMVYLNTVREGGATWFPSAGVKVPPHQGMLLAWNNMKPDGSPNPMTLHEGMAVVAGTKYIVTKWFREGRWT